MRPKIISSVVADGSMSVNGDPSAWRRAEKFLQKNNIKAELAMGEQLFTNRVKIIEKPGLISNVDGLLTNADLTLAVRTADCVPLMIYDESSGLIGALHISRLNLTKGIFESLKDLLPTPCASLHAFLGPHIRVKNYPLKDESAARLKNTKWEKYLKNISGRPHFDLTGAAIGELELLGVKRENINDCGIDTFEDEHYFSYRRQKIQPIPTFLTVITRCHPDRSGGNL